MEKNKNVYAIIKGDKWNFPLSINFKIDENKSIDEIKNLIILLFYKNELKMGNEFINFENLKKDLWNKIIVF